MFDVLWEKNRRSARRFREILAALLAGTLHRPAILDHHSPVRLALSLLDTSGTEPKHA